ncbi:tyrosine-protein phosphatase corkscrew-like isoform X3 [Mya arenaria]|uniref:tyrosine-protein phosphatase corkscrew-like isoform X3 n=1 Tax=Mya arenaria TaxID=6604 RepID=UPI0022E58EB9|nr:tyrosine-protein phosphatase corkscrew-like isoform X3 [Mya arenaria]
MAEDEHSMDVMLLRNPWFHGTLGRREAEKLVLKQSHGVFLIRRSNTRKGEYVFTVNFHKKARHLEMTINNEGRCDIGWQRFKSVSDMLQRYQTTPIPMKNGKFDMTLTTYVEFRSTGDPSLEDPRAEDHWKPDHNTIELMLLEQPWFHATLSRLEAEQLVLPQSHGVFLIRRSNTRKGEYVLTVNFHDKAMHLRVTINNEGRCETELQWFNSVLDMIQHFYHNPIPMVHGTFDMTLTTYVDYRT